MDDLQFRRSIYADPHCDDDNVKQAAAEDPKKQEFWSDLKKLDANIREASKIDVPEGLAQRLILRQSLQSHRSQKRKTRVQLALAASVAFVFGVSFTLWQQQTLVDLGEHALAHVYHEYDGYALKADNDIPLHAVNAQLASMGTQFTEQVSRIYYASYCNFEGIRSFHMVMEGENGKVTVFILPPDSQHNAPDGFGDGQLHGETLDLQHARFIMVGEQGQALSHLREKLKQSVVFSA